MPQTKILPRSFGLAVTRQPTTWSGLANVRSTTLPGTSVAFVFAASRHFLGLRTTENSPGR